MVVESVHNEEVAQPNGGSPAYGRERFYCPRCRAFAAQQWFDVRVGPYANIFADEEVAGADWHVAQCTSCDRYTLWRGAKMIFPRATTAPFPHGEMPDEVRELYDEASGVEQVSPRASAALARAALERLLKHLEPDLAKATLDERIAKLESQVSAPLWEMLTVLRYVGNESLHGDSDDVIAMVLNGPLAETAELLYETINDTVEELIARPARSKATYARLPQGIREAAERKAQAQKRDGK